MSIKEIISFVLIILVLIGLFILLICSMKTTIHIENERKQKEIEFYKAFIKWCDVHTNDCDEVEKH